MIVGSRCFVLNRLFLRGLVGMLALCALAFNTPARDWPMWGGSEAKNLASEEKGLPETFVPGEKDPGGKGVIASTTKNVKWAYKSGTYGVSSPTVVGDRVLIGNCNLGQGVMRCLDAKTGKMIWQYAQNQRKVPRFIEGREFMLNYWQTIMGVSSTATVDGDRVYFVSQRCEVLCLDLNGDPKRAGKPNWVTSDTSHVIWEFDLYEKLGVRPANVANGTVLIHGDYAYVCTGNGVDRVPDAAKHDELRPPPAPDAPTIIVLDKMTGRLVAKDDIKMARGPRMFHGNYSGLSKGEVGGKTLIFFGGGDGLCYAFEPVTAAAVAANAAVEQPATLKVAWSFDCIPAEYQAEARKNPKWNLIKAYCLGDKRRSDSTNKKNDGTWVGMAEIIATPTFYNNKLYVAIGRDPAHGRGRGALWCIDPAKGEGDITNTAKIWCYQGLDRTISNVSIADGLLYIADVAGRVHCLDADTGKLNWVFEDSKAEVWGSTLVADGKVYLPTHKGLWVLAASKELKVITPAINVGAPIYAPPVAANGTLYVAAKNYLYAVQNQESQLVSK